MAHETKEHPVRNAALEAMAQSFRLAASQPPRKAAETVRNAVDKYSASYSAPALRQLFRGRVSTTSAALSRAHGAVAWQPVPFAAPRLFRDSLTGLAWQMTHFESVLQCLGPAPTPESTSAARVWVAARSKRVPAVEVEAYIHDMSMGAEIKQAFVMRLLHLGGPAGVRVQGTDNLARALCSEFERTLGGVHEAVRDLFVRAFKKQAHILPARRRPQN